MFSRLLLVCCLGFQFNSLLGLEEAYYGETKVTFLTLNELDIENPIDGGLFYFRDKQRSYWAQVARCKELFPASGVEVTLIKNENYLLAASNLTTIDRRAYYRIGLTLQNGVWDPWWKLKGTWTWEDGSTLSEDDHKWRFDQPESTINSPVKRNRKCSRWRPDDRSDLKEDGTLRAGNCRDEMYHAMCQISDIDECQDSPCTSLSTCINTAGGFTCEFSGTAAKVYETVANYYNKVYACGEDNTPDNSAPASCSPYARTHTDSVCYDEAYATCTKSQYDDMTQELGDIYDIMVDCMVLPCALGAEECHDDDVDTCPDHEYPELFANLKKCAPECNLLAACGKGGFDCVTNYDECKSCFENLQ